MGFGSNGGKTVFSAEGFSMADVIDVGFGLRRRNTSHAADGDGNQRPNIAVDGNWVAYQRMNTAGGPVGGTCQVLLDWATNGAIMWPICDGDTRPIVKQASNKNHATRKKGENKATLARLDLRKVNATINEGGLDNEARSNAQEERAKLQKDIKRGESQSKHVPKNFQVLLAGMLDNLSAHKIDENSHGTVREVFGEKNSRLSTSCSAIGFCLSTWLNPQITCSKLF